LADVVLGGGGVRGIAHVGAVAALERHGYELVRAAGSSAGSLVAAAVAAGLSAARLGALLEGEIDLARFPDARGLSRLGWPGRAISLVLQKGVFEGDYLRGAIHDVLKREAGVERFGDLRLTPGVLEHLPPNRRYRLVVIVADASRGQLVRLPWDYREYGLDPDRQFVADAVRASAAIPFFFKPARLAWTSPSTNVSLLVDGGAVSDFPVEIFDPTDGRLPDWPSFGIKLAARPRPGALLNTITDTLGYALALLETAVNGNDQVHLADPCVQRRTVFVDTPGVHSKMFEISAAEREALIDSGDRATEDFLRTWDWSAFLRDCTSDEGWIDKALAAQGDWEPGQRSAPTPPPPP
jgi:NTE family protein